MGPDLIVDNFRVGRGGKISVISEQIKSVAPYEHLL